MVSWFRQFCIHVSDIDATIKFYETLGLECTSRTKITDDIDEAVIENPERGAWIQLAQNKTITPPIDMGTAMWKLYVYTDDCQERLRPRHRGRVQVGDAARDVGPLAGDDRVHRGPRRLPGRARPTRRGTGRAQRGRNAA